MTPEDPYWLPGVEDGWVVREGVADCRPPVGRVTAKFSGEFLKRVSVEVRATVPGVAWVGAVRDGRVVFSPLELVRRGTVGDAPEGDGRTPVERFRVKLPQVFRRRPVRVWPYRTGLVVDPAAYRVARPTDAGPLSARDLRATVSGPWPTGAPLTSRPPEMAELNFHRRVRLGIGED